MRGFTVPLASLALSVLAPGVHAMDLAAFNRAENAAYPQVYRDHYTGRARGGLVQPSDGYNCVGMTALKARDLHRLGVPYADMHAVFVDHAAHMVLEVDGVALDNAVPEPRPISLYGDVVRADIQIVMHLSGVGN